LATDQLKKTQILKVCAIREVNLWTSEVGEPEELTVEERER
jgi:hypothetical protein